MSDRMAGLGGQPSTDIGIGHRCQRMVLHTRLVQQPVFDEEVPLINGASGTGKSRTNDDFVRIERIGQGVGHGSDVSRRSRIEGGAVLEEELLTALGPEPGQRFEGQSYSLIGTDRAGFQRDDPGLDIGPGGFGRHAGILHCAHSALGKGVGQIARSGEIITDASQQHHFSPGRVRPAFRA